MKDAKMLLIIKNCDVELAEKILKLVGEHNASKRKKQNTKRAA